MKQKMFSLKQNFEIVDAKLNPIYHVEGKMFSIGRQLHIYDAQTPSAENVISAPVNVYELLGAEVYLYSEVEGKNLTARVEPGTHAKVGDMMHYGLKTDMIHVFDKETEQVITN